MLAQFAEAVVFALLVGCSITANKPFSRTSPPRHEVVLLYKSISSQRYVYCAGKYVLEHPQKNIFLCGCS